MEQTKHSLDLRTLLLLMVEHEDVSWDKVMELIAEEVDVPADRLKSVITKHGAQLSTQPKANSVPATKVQNFGQRRDTKRSYSRWEEQRLNELVARWNDGQKPGQIAKEMGVSTQTVYQKISRLRKTRNDIKARHSRNPAFAAKSSVES